MHDCKNIVPVLQLQDCQQAMTQLERDLKKTKEENSSLSGKCAQYELVRNFSLLSAAAFQSL